MGRIEHLAIIALTNILIYWKTLYYGYVGDDVERSERKEPKFKNRYHRWWIQFIGLRHTHPMVAHFISLVVHTACCLTVYVALGMNQLSFLTAILFSINPVNIQGSVWISGRNYVTSSILTLCMFIFPHISWIFYTAVSHFAVNAWFAPLAFLGTEHWYMVGIIPVVWILTQHNRATLNRKLWETGGLKTTNNEMRSIKVKKLIPFIKTYSYYFVLAILPFRIGVEHTYLRGFGTNKTDNEEGYSLDRHFYLGLALILIVSTIIINGLLAGWTPFSWGLFWFSINIAMWCNFVTYQQHISERYVYLANIGMMYALAHSIIQYPVVIAVFITGYVVRLIQIMDMFMDDYWAVEYSIMDDKRMYYMWLMRGVKKFCAKDYPGALFDFNQAYINKPHDMKVLYNLAVTYFLLGNPDKAKEFLDKARNNTYDGLSDIANPAFDVLEQYIEEVLKARKKGQQTIHVDLRKVMVVK